MTSAPGVLPRRTTRLWVPALVLALIASMFPIAVDPSWLPPARAAGPCDAPVVSKVACENTQPGSPPSEWQVAGAGNTTIQGYATSMSVNIGQAVTFKVKTTASAYRIDIYRLGYYQGQGARKVAANILSSVPLPQSQPNCLTFSATGLIDCGNWAVSASWNIPATAVSGVYIARLVRTDNGGASVIPFVVRDDAAHSDVLFQTSDTTWQAYNSYGGNSLYTCTVACPAGNPLAYKAAFKVSYNRPFITAGDAQGQNWLMYAEYPMIRFLEANGYDVSYLSGLDAATRGPLLLNHKSFLSVGHDEYWSAEQRTNVTAARDAGVNLAFLSGNEMFWKTRWESSSDGSNTAGRTLVSYKDTHFNAPTDPISWTGTWRDPRYGTATGGGNPENALTGQYFVVNSGTTDIVVPAAYKQLRLWRGTSIPNMASGTSVTLGSGLGTLGYEWDVDADNGFRPAGTFRLSETTSNTAEVFTDYGSSTQQGGTATHNLTLYKASSGALVFGAGTVQWTWGLDAYTTGKPVDRNMQQATVNLLADMGTQPLTLMAGLSAAQASTDATAPTSRITTPAAGVTVADSTLVTVSGTATDSGGVVAGVEVSTDGGNTWRRATGTNNWSYSWTAHGSPTSVLRSRAVDDSGNLEGASAGSAISVSCPCSITGVNRVPAMADSGDTAAIEVGAKFYSEVAGTVNSIRFYKATRNTGTHIGSIWSSSGQRLATATFTNESASGWQSVALSPPLVISANTTYVVSYFAPAGRYSQDTGFFYNNPSPAGAVNQLDSAPLHFPRSLPGSPNGVYRYGASSSFPNQVYDAEYYWVDLSFTPSGAVQPAVSSVSPINNAADVSTGIKPSATFNQTVTATSVVFSVKSSAGANVAGTTTYDPATNTSTFTPAASLGYSTTYTATVSGATNSAGQTMASAYTWTFTTGAPPPAPAVATVSPANNALAVPVDTKPNATFNQAVSSGSINFALKDAGNNSVTGSVAYDSATNTATFAPAGLLAYNTTYSATVSGASNAAGQSMSAPYSWSFTTAAAPGACPCSVFSPGDTPSVPSENDPGAVEVGMKFRSDVAGTVTGVRFYKGAGNTGTHTGHLWSATGTLLGTVSFQSESAAGWQQANFTTPVSIAANTTYVVSYYAPNGAYSADVSFFNTSRDKAPLHGLSNGADGPNGVYRYGTSGFPNQTYNATNYWVDVVFSSASSSTAPRVSSVTPVNLSNGVDVNVKPSATFDQQVTASSVTFTLRDAANSAVAGAVAYDPATNTARFTPAAALAYNTTFTATVSGATNSAGQGMAGPFSWTFSTSAAPLLPAVTSTSPVTNASAVPANTKPSATFNQDVTPSSVLFMLKGASNNSVQGSMTYDAASRTATFTPASALAFGAAYTATVSGATNATGQAMTAPYSWSFTTETAPVVCPCSIFSPASVPGTVTALDSNAVEVGMKFRADTAGTVTGIRFYKGSSNTGTHVGHLWSSTGSLMASVTFANESASGWQEALFSSPVPLAANTTYVVSYFAPDGFYSADSGYFNNSVDNAPLHGLAAGVDGPNGVYRYGASAFPSDSYNNTNYWVDIVFAASSSGTAPAVAAVSPANATTGVSEQVQPTATFNQSVTASSIGLTVKNAAGTNVAGSIGYDAATNTATFVPQAALAYQTTYTATVTAATSTSGTAMASPFSWSFTTKAPPAACPCSVFSPAAVPTTANTNDRKATEVGMKFRSDVAGMITGVRFYKGSSNTGTHIGHLWTANGTLLATATFTNESASGWQEALFSSPVAIQANTTYVVSYYAPAGFYSSSRDYFSNSGVDNAPLHALANGIDGPNGVYVYGASAFPTETFRSTNYWVDVIFNRS
ncbi:conserved hypothetical protein [Pseudarthrobacter chlorophenolicus A6]|uniref:DUF4082 domain-containing protein n=1 Tax=Pseudarthrobacter chlorophenolicus (strain ATCC 700700 / DSM 12829 / CIP 107037 / JCM 12360 / KCTC 9906 / NCIMB 13794 / A6) TaxID=452863 RepID=B8H8W6_PSECP|nr:DUF4082 domain-containing protein [Pseudarthrobacter chlorophenolicus]ACL41861.1 conserved hypothetical protein [Pseudarthrobacter chlorophenolicus A6]SDQ57268.1 Ig-like domain-containing protein [Pseudarthrobacter chlorophenolicus]